MRRTKPVAAPMVARVYLRVSTDAQDLTYRKLKNQSIPLSTPYAT